ncbi:hypothetical protein [Neptuniibacter sp. QD37_11]|uniref:hypothetical protein n=1 Tax=Neptuniibacter sp. QD37_11 TaxID=3398209 RepID=UPI0039F62522
MFKRVMLASVFTVGVSTANATGVIPTGDAPVLAETMAGNLQNMLHYARNELLMQSEIEGEGLQTALFVDGLNNGFANTILRNSLTAEKKRESEVKEQAMYDLNACDNFAITTSLDDIVCDVQAKKESKSSARRNKTSGFISAEGLSDYAASRKSDLLPKEEKQNILDECIAAVDPTVTGDEGQKGSLCTRADVLLGSKGSVISPVIDKEMDRVIDVIAHNIPVPQPEGLTNAKSPHQSMNWFRQIAIRNQVNHSFEEIKGMRTDDGNGRSQLAMLELFVNQRFGTDESGQFIAELGAANGNKNQVTETGDRNALVMPTEVLRRMAAMESFGVYMDLLQYKQQMRMEGLMATLVSLELKPIVK